MKSFRFVAFTSVVLFLSAPAGALDGLQHPVAGKFRTTSGFGPRIDPITGVTTLHLGKDYVAKFGSPVRAAARGAVIDTGPREGYGLVVEIDHGDGWTTLYAHLSRIVTVRGAYAEPGSVIAEFGDVGASTGPHLHFELRKNGEPVDPAPFLPAKKAAAAK